MISFAPLWETLAIKKLRKTDLYEILTSRTVAKLSKNEVVKSDTIDKICEFLDCELEDVCRHVKSREVERKK
jgi:DNA-binding Xre family transcriptional regulator